MVIRNSDFLDCYYPENEPMDHDRFVKVLDHFVNVIVENKFSISEIRYLFRGILNDFEIYMPVSKDVNYE